MKLKNLLTEAESFTATNKKTGKTSVFKTKDSRDSAIKAGTHDKTGGDGDSKKSAKSGVNIFDNPADEPTKSVQAKGGAGSGRDSKEIAKAKKQLKKDHPDWDDSKINQTARALMGHTRIGKKPFKKKEEPKVDEPKAASPALKPTTPRKGNPQVNVAAKKTAEKYGITPQKLGNEKYKEAMFQAAVSALTDSNFHSEARELVAAIEGKPEFAKKPEYPSIKDPKYKEKMADIRKNSADGSVYMNGTGDIDDYGTDVSQASGWDGVDAADGIAFTLRMNGFHREADMIQSVFNDKPYMKDSKKESKTSLKSIMKK